MPAIPCIKRYWVTKLFLFFSYMTPALRRFFIGLVLFGQLLPMTIGLAHAQTSVTLQLKWFNSFQFAGYYMAKELGFYRDAGLDVTFKEYRSSMDIVQEIVSGRANYGVGTSSLLISKYKGEPVVVLAPIFQHSPLVMIVPRKTPPENIHDLVGKRIMIDPLSHELLAYLSREGITPDKYTLVNNTSIQELIKGQVDAAGAYLSEQPFVLNEANYSYDLLSPRSAGIDFYGDNLFTSEEELKKFPERTDAFLEASLRGWQYAMKHPQVAIDLILKNNPSGKSRAALEFEAEKISSLIKADQVDIGYTYPGRWQHIASIYSEIGLIGRDFTLGNFLYLPNAQKDRSAIYLTIAISLVIALLLSGFVIYVARKNRLLQNSLAIIKSQNQQIELLALRDKLTQLPNRYLLRDRVQLTLAHCKRAGNYAALIFLDLDNFKPLNDRYGHRAGDLLLIEVGNRLQKCVRQVDTVCRFGGDEFVVLLESLSEDPSIARAEARLVALKILKKLGEPYLLGMPMEGHTETVEHHCTASIGVRIFSETALTEEQLIDQADSAMYRAKQAGRNNIFFYD